MKIVGSELARQLLKDRCIPAELVADDASMENLGLDSLDMVEMEMVVEETLGVRVGLTDGGFQLDWTLGALGRYIQAIIDANQP